MGEASIKNNQMSFEHVNQISDNYGYSLCLHVPVIL